MAEIKLKCGAIAIVDDEDFSKVDGVLWRLNVDGYAMRKTSIKGKRGCCVFIHRMLMNAQPGDIVDHIDNNRLNNSRSNLRFADTATNSFNRLKRKGGSSKHKGVSLTSKNGKYEARIKAYGKNIHLGTFVDEDEAGHAYNKAAIIYFGEFATLNPIGQDKEPHNERAIA